MTAEKPKRDKRDKATRRRDEIREKKGATTYDRIKAGEIIPEGQQKGWANLQPDKYKFSVMDKEKHREISRKGGEAVQKLHGEKRTAKQALENILTLRVNDKIIAGAELDPELAERLKRSMPDATLYDLMQIVAAGKAVGGNMKAYELIRDTYGDMPIKQVEITENITTDSDREMLRLIADRLKQTDVVIVEDQTREDGTGKDDNT